MSNLLTFLRTTTIMACCAAMSVNRCNAQEFQSSLENTPQQNQSANDLASNSASIDSKIEKSKFGAFNNITDFLIGIWQTELYLAKRQTYQNDKVITVYRSVTVGKVTRLLFIFTIGGLLLRVISQYLQRLLFRRLHLSFTVSTLTSKWVFGCGLGILIIYGLNTVHIPFTALAFLGGTLAIGIGFGTQTILKNFISGIILMIEQPFKVGDFVEVDDVHGKISSIGIRASIIKHIDGVDTLIPNSSMLENKVTNWTLSNNKLRHSVSIGVSYDSPVQEVAHLLIEAANDHGLILDSPKPEVYFDNFGDSALQFRLLFWLDTGKSPRAKLASDLRFMIHKKFETANISIPYPQRDIHFDSSKPLRVELSQDVTPASTQ